MTQLSPGVRFFLGMITFLLCIVLFVSALAGILISNITQVFSSQENLEGLLRQVMFVDLKQPVSVRTVSTGSNAPSMRHAPVKTLAPAARRLSESQSTNSMVSYVYQALAEGYGDKIKLPMEDIQEFVQQSTVDDFLVEKGADLISDVYTGQSTVTLTPEEIQTQITQNAPLIEDVFGVTVSEELVNKVTTAITANKYVSQLESDGILNVLLNITGKDYNPMKDPSSFGPLQVIETLRTLFSPAAVLVIGIICLLLVGMLLMVNYKQVWTGLTAGGITLLVASLPAVLLTIAVLVIPSGWAKAFGLFSIVEALVRHIILSNAAICIGVFVVGLVLIIGGSAARNAATRNCMAALEADAMANQVFAEAPVYVDFSTEETEEETE